MTYNVFGGTLNLTQPNPLSMKIQLLSLLVLRLNVINYAL